MRISECGLRNSKNHALADVNTTQDRLAVRMRGRGLSDGAGKDKQAPYGATTNHESFGACPYGCGFSKSAS